MRDKLVDKSYLEYAKISRYSNSPYYYNKTDNKYIGGTTYNLDDTTESIYYTVEPGDSYDSIALRFYDSPLYYWIICDFNRIHDCFKKPEVGTKLKIPTFSALRYDKE